jgi:hypothetical protein
VKSSGKPMEIVEKLNQMAGFAPEEEIQLYEVCVPTIIISSIAASHCSNKNSSSIYFINCGSGNKV